MRCHSKKREASWNHGVNIRRKNRLEGGSFQPQPPSLMMPSGSKQTSQLSLSHNTHKPSAPHIGHLTLKIGESWSCSSNHWNRIHLPKMLILNMFPHHSLCTGFPLCLECSSSHQPDQVLLVAQVLDQTPPAWKGLPLPPFLKYLPSAHTCLLTPTTPLKFLHWLVFFN